MHLLEIVDTSTGLVIDNEVRTTPRRDRVLALRVNGEDIPSHVDFKEKGASNLYFPHDTDDWQLISRVPLSELATMFHQIRFSVRQSWLSKCGAFAPTADIIVERGLPPTSRRGWSVSASYNPTLEAWSFPWTFAEATTACEEACAERTSPQFRSEPRPALLFFTHVGDDLATMVNALDLCRHDVTSAAAVALVLLEKMYPPDSITRQFNFHPAFRGACEQYLSYFGQFLADLGIQAETTTRSAAHRVLFEVRPADGGDALEKVREALDLYLNLPWNPDYKARASASTDVAVRQLSSAVAQLQSFMHTENALLTTLAAQSLTNLKLSQTIEGSLAQLAANESKPNPDRESILGDYVYLTPVEGYGLGLDVPGLIRALRRRIDGGSAK